MLILVGKAERIIIILINVAKDPDGDYGTTSIVFVGRDIRGSGSGTVVHSLGGLCPALLGHTTDYEVNKLSSHLLTSF